MNLKGKLLGMIFLLLVLLPIIASAATYYVSNSGADTNSGTSSSLPWKTISKINSASFNPGDSILFKRGDAWFEELIVPSSGSAGSPITFGAYGTGNKPLISGFATLSSWSSLGGGIYQSSCASCTSSDNMLALNGVAQALGRYPNTGYLTFESHLGKTSITDNQLTGTPDWIGAEVVIRTTRWTLDKSLISSHSANTLTYAPVTEEPADGFGYFIQRDSKTLDQLGEWYFDSSANGMKVFFGANNPDSYNVQTSVIDYLAYVNGRDYITFDQLSFEGANLAALYVFDAQHITVQNCNVDLSGTNAITASFSTYVTVENCSINQSLNDAIVLTWGCPDSSIRRNTIKNTALMAGMGSSGTGTYAGIQTYGSHRCIIEYNEVDNTGYDAIFFGGNSTIVRNNVIDTFCTVKDDGAGIYTGAGSLSHMGSQVTGNIVLNGIGAGQGTNNPTYLAAEGIYMDDNSNGVEISGNTVANCANNGMFLHNAHELNIRNNTFFNNNRQINFQHDSGAANIRNNIISNNIFFSKTASQLCLNSYSSSADTSLLGVSDNNYYVRPLDDTYDIHTAEITWTSHAYTLEGWQATYNQDLASKKSPQNITDVNDIRFEYNPTNAIKTVTLSMFYIDVDGTRYSNSIMLQPYASIVLIKDSNQNSTQQPVPGDIDGDLDVDLQDLIILINDFGKTSNFINSKSDTNSDNIVDIFDVVYVASRLS
jgi:parallel beta-helix repeat protein